MDFSDKSVLITGGSRGIGQAIAVAFANKGARVAIVYRSNAEAAQKTVDQLFGNGHCMTQGDVGIANDAERMVDEVIKKLGQIDILVNNAGIGIDHQVDKVGLNDWQAAWQQTLQTNLIGPANMSFCVSQHMIDNGGGRIVNVSSRGAFRGEPTQPAYGASKAGLNSLSQSLAISLAPHKIFVGTVAPGYVHTEMTEALLMGEEGAEIRQQSPLHRIAKPEEVAHAVLFLASDGAEFTTGTIIDVNGASYLRT
ncbi:MAG: SDR family NAD(P)-dependent oxidoreductase [Gammaproteobacteria bacterium]|nr:SDR family NAD(P)-dependent oxidoreductase [Gammaproteobacteria bacterium]MDD9896434.1 SDR family NAD(P)-dependent oxidoreductase [Gammaproteobacteria bacterium]MDD9959529.1 SDR family NAD(P)-dependent oxidoreductase [Gammaproteobacteria bacterium]